MTAAGFRRIALGLDGAAEGAHMGHADFRVGTRIFASLTADESRGMAKLTPDQQERLVREHPDVFEPENGAWGRQGCTRVRFTRADAEVVGEALTLAWQNLARVPRRGKVSARR